MPKHSAWSVDGAFRSLQGSLVLIFLALCCICDANAQTSTLVSVQVGNIGYLGGPTTSCSSSSTTALSASCQLDQFVQMDCCQHIGVQVDGFASASIDSAGLHVFATETLSTSGQVYGGYGANSAAAAQYADQLHVSSSLATNAVLTFTAVGGVSGQATATFQAGYGPSGCIIYNSGTCSFVDSVSLGGFVGFLMSETCQLAVDVAATYAPVAQCNFGNTAYLSSLYFTDAQGNRLNGVTYTSASGYTYPQAELVPEPATVALFLVGLLAIGAETLRRKRVN